ncbi:hypothetical protein V5O48_018799 [Marasmius crinis-equi]|uniref:Uncharacterized protein n=1 Tax=Marasmius crinis-equi TaxID=585013 RepID=A0ABR3EK65_9AGAR
MGRTVACIAGPFEVIVPYAVEKPDPALLNFDFIRSAILRTIPGTQTTIQTLCLVALCPPLTPIPPLTKKTK